MRAVAYCRVSSKAQRDKHTIDSQLRELPAFVAGHGWRLVRPITHYVDDGRSAKAGLLGDREAFARLLRDAAAGEFDVVAVVDLDRITRSEDIAERGRILGAFQQAGVKLAELKHGQVLDLATSQGDMMTTLFAFFAAEENRKKRERTISGKLTAVSRGRKPAGPTPYGLRFDRETGAWSIDATEAELVREMYRRVAAGESCHVIALDFAARGIARPRGGEWIRERVWQIVTARTYRGEWTADKRRRLVIPVPAIVDVELWERAQVALMAHGKRGLRRTKHVYLLEGIAACALCGAAIGIASAQSAGRRVACPSRYVCGHRRRPPFASPRCRLPYQPTAELDDRLWRQLLDVIGRPDVLERAIGVGAELAADAAAWQRDLDGADARLKKLVTMEVSLLDRHQRGALSGEALDVALGRVTRERLMVEKQRESARRALLRAERDGGRAEALRDALRRTREQLAAASQEARRHVVAALLEPGSVVVSATEITATLRIAAQAPGGAPGISSSHLNALRIRLVA